MSFCWLRSRCGTLPGIGVGGRVTDTGSMTRIGDGVCLCGNGQEGIRDRASSVFDGVVG